LSCQTLVGRHSVRFQWINGVFGVDRLQTTIIEPLNWTSIDYINDPTNDESQGIAVIAITQATTNAINGTVYTDSRTSLHNFVC